MTFPTIPTAANGRLLSNVQADTTATRTFPSLTGLTKSSGDLLIAIITAYQSSVTNAAFSGWSTGWTELSDSSSSTTMAIGIAYKWSTGSETGTISVTQAATITGQATMILLSIAGAHATSPPQVSSRVSGTTSAAASGTISPSWGSDDNLFIAVSGSGETSLTGSFTGNGSAPTNYTSYAETGISQDAIGGVGGAVAFRQLTAASDTVGAFAVDTSNARNAGIAIAVRPAPPPTPTQTPTAQISLGSPPSGVPATQAGYSLHVRARASVAAQATIRMNLWEGATDRSGVLESSLVTASFAEYTLAISDANAAAIVDHTNLSVTVWGYSVGGSTPSVDVADLWLAMPAGTSTGATATPPSARVRVRAQPPAFSVSATLTPLAGRVRIRASAPSAGISYTVQPAAAASVRVRSATPAATAGASVTPSSAQVRVRARAPSFASSAALTVGTGQARVRTATPTAAASSSVTPPSAAVRARASAASTSATVSVTAPSARVRIRTSPPSVAAGLGANPPAAQVRVRASAPTTSASASTTAASARVAIRAFPAAAAATVSVSTTTPAARVRIRASPPSIAVGLGASPPAAQIRVRAGTPTVTASASTTAKTGRVTIRAFPAAAGASASAQPAAARVVIRTARPSLASNSTFSPPAAAVRVRGTFPAANTGFAPNIDLPTTLALKPETVSLSTNADSVTLALKPSAPTLALGSSNATLTVKGSPVTFAVRPDAETLAVKADPMELAIDG